MKEYINTFNQLSVRDVRKKYKTKQVLENISFQASPGDCIGILGENGCGKSTLLSILAGVLEADQGSFLLDDRNLLKKKKLRSRVVGYVPQGTPLLQELTALDNLKLWYAGSGYDLNEDLRQGVPALLGVSEFLKVPVSRMSGGMKKRLSISCAVAHRPRILLMDEPGAALDLACKEEIATYIRSFKAQGGIILLATHELPELELCSQCYIMKQGILHPYHYDGDSHHLVELLQP